MPHKFYFFFISMDKLSRHVFIINAIFRICHINGMYIQMNFIFYGLCILLYRLFIFVKIWVRLYRKNRFSVILHFQITV